MIKPYLFMILKLKHRLTWSVIHHFQKIHFLAITKLTSMICVVSVCKINSFLHLHGSNHIYARGHRDEGVSKSLI